MNKNSVVIYDNEPRAGTFLISVGFERDHYKVLRLIDKYKDRFLRLENSSRLSKSLTTRKVKVNKTGRPVEEYMINEAQTFFLGTLFRNSDLVLDFKEKLAGDFVKIKRKLYELKQYKENPEYNVARDAGKLIRKTATDEMKKFIEYAKEQGSDNAVHYYSNITRMVNTLLFIAEGHFKCFRDVLSIPQLMIVSAAEGIVDKGLRDGMKAGRHYKLIYQDIKDNVQTFAKMHGQSEVISQQLALTEE